MEFLEFVEISDYVEYLKSNDIRETRLEITVHGGAPSGQYGIASVTYYGVATQRLGDHIAYCKFDLVYTDTLNLRQDKFQKERGEETTKDRLHRNFQKLKAVLEEHGLTVERGMWKLSPADFT